MDPTCFDITVCHSLPCFEDKGQGQGQDQIPSASRLILRAQQLLSCFEQSRSIASHTNFVCDQGAYEDSLADAGD